MATVNADGAGTPNVPSLAPSESIGYSVSPDIVPANGGEAGGGFRAALSGFFMPGEYQSVKFVRVKSRVLASVHRLIFLLCLGYVVGFQIIVGKGYQKVDQFTSALDIKVKGVASSVGMDGQVTVFDAIDLVQPALEESAVFVQTNVWETQQQRGLCAGVDRHSPPNPPAQISEQCIESSSGERTCLTGMRTANGITTGRCIDTNDGSRNDISRYGIGYMCEVRAWCPIEHQEAQNDPGLPQVGNFTMFVRVDGRFNELASSETFSNFASGELMWNSNLFYLSDLVAAAATGQTLEIVPADKLGNSTQNSPRRLPYQYFEEIVEKGAELVVDYSWDCNLDRHKDCSTRLNVHRIDEGKGFNYRSAVEFVDPETKNTTRKLAKRYGLRVVFRVTGHGGKFDPVTLGVVLGSGLGLLGIATVVADMLLFSRPSMRVFQEAKYESVVESTRTEPNNAGAQPDPLHERLLIDDDSGSVRNRR